MWSSLKLLELDREDVEQLEPVFLGLWSKRRQKGALLMLCQIKH